MQQRLTEFCVMWGADINYNQIIRTNIQCKDFIGCILGTVCFLAHAHKDS